MKSNRLPKKKNQLVSFPEDIWLEIFRYLEPKDLLKVSLISTIFHPLSQSNRLWEQFSPDQCKSKETSYSATYFKDKYINEFLYKHPRFFQRTIVEKGLNVVVTGNARDVVTAWSTRTLFYFDVMYRNYSQGRQGLGDYCPIVLENFIDTFGPKLQKVSFAEVAPELLEYNNYNKQLFFTTDILVVFLDGGSELLSFLDNKYDTNNIPLTICCSDDSELLDKAKLSDFKTIKLDSKHLECDDSLRVYNKIMRIYYDSNNQHKMNHSKSKKCLVM